MNHRLLGFAAAFVLATTGTAFAQGAPGSGAGGAGGATPSSGGAAVGGAAAGGAAAGGAAAGGSGAGAAPTEKPKDWVDAPPVDGSKPADPNAKPTDPNAKPANPDDKFGTDEDAGGKKKESATKFYLGAHFRDFVAPGFIFEWFADGGPGAVNVFSGGPEFVIRSGALEVVMAVTVPYADYSMNEFVFKSKSDPDQAYEIVSAGLKLVGVTVDLLGRIELEKKGTVALLLGGGVGLSGVIGDIKRNQVYPDDPNRIDPYDPAKWNKCKAPGDGGTSGQTPDGHNYCGTDNDHYGDYSEASWSDGGSKPIVWPYIALPHIALEVNPIEQFFIRADTGFSISGFFFGLGAGGKLPI